MLVKKFRVLRNRRYLVNNYIKARTIGRNILDKENKHRIMVLVNQLIKNGNIDFAIKTVGNVINQLYNEESVRRSKFGGAFYIYEGLKKIEIDAELKPVKKKGRIRFKKVIGMSYQKSISKAVSKLIKKCYETRKKTRQSLETVLKEEFKDLFIGVSKIYRKNQEAIKEMIETRYRITYDLQDKLETPKLKKVRKKKKVLVKKQWWKLKYWKHRYKGKRHKKSYKITVFEKLILREVFDKKKIYLKVKTEYNKLTEKKYELKNEIRQQGWQYYLNDLKKLKSNDNY